MYNSDLFSFLLLMSAFQWYILALKQNLQFSEIKPIMYFTRITMEIKCPMSLIRNQESILKSMINVSILGNWKETKLKQKGKKKKELYSRKYLSINNQFQESCLKTCQFANTSFVKCQMDVTRVQIIM